MSLEQPVRGSAAYEKNDQIRPAALIVKEFADAAKYKAQAGKVKAQAEQEKAQAETEFPGQYRNWCQKRAGEGNKGYQV